MGNSCLYKYLSGISVYSVQYLGWITAIVAAILALTSIVFSQFNERSIQKANDLARGIKNKINEDIELINSPIVKEDFRHMAYLLTNSSIYKNTLFLFEWVSYFIVFLWWFSVIGYIKHAETFADKTLIFLSTILLSIPFLFLPKILKRFNNNQPLSINKKDELNIKELIRFMKENTSLSEAKLISDFLNPTVRIELKNRKLFLYSLTEVDAVNFTIMFVIKGEENRITINVEKNKKGLKNIYSIKPIDGEGTTYDEGLYRKFTFLVGSEVVIFFCKSQDEYISFKGKIQSRQGVIDILIQTINNQTLDISSLNQKNNLMVQPALGEAKNYKLIENNK